MSTTRQISTLIKVSLAWIISSRRQARKRHPGTVHVLYCMCDHYEPGSGKVSAEVGTQRVEDLLEFYPKIADAHVDSDGRKPRRSWFFPPHYHQNGWLKKLVSLCERGYGEIELHLHHGKQIPDTSENLKRTLDLCVEEYSIFGIFGQTSGIRKFGFIHGDWALDNSRHGEFCGVNDEISILNETGCFADFTFPCYNEANPEQINSIYYATDDTAKPKSHNRGIPVNTRGGPTIDHDLMMVEGPFHPYFRNGKLRGLRIYGDAVDNEQEATRARIDAWVRTGIAVQGKENWVVVKTHTHGATDSKVALGQNMHVLFDHLEKKYRDGQGYALHYVTARELYNIIKAAEAGEIGENPADYKNYTVSAPLYDSTPSVLEASETLRALVGKTYHG